MTTRPNRRRRRAITVALAMVAVATAAFLAWGPALTATQPPLPASASTPSSTARVPAIADPAVSGTDLVPWAGPAAFGVLKSRHETVKNTILNAR